MSWNLNILAGESSSAGATLNYEKFGRLTGNRNIDLKHVDRLVESIQKSGYNGVPILIDDDWRILDGQHRFEALKRLELPVPYLKSQAISFEAVLDWNNFQKKWRLEDYVRAFAERGIEPYQRLLEMSKRFGRTIAICAQLANGWGSAERNPDGKFKKGAWNPSDEDFFEAEQTLHEMLMIDVFCPGFSSKRTAVAAYKRLRAEPAFNFSSFIANAEILAHRIPRAGRGAEYLRGLLGIYNYNKKVNRLEIKGIKEE